MDDADPRSSSELARLSHRAWLSTAAASAAAVVLTVGPARATEPDQAKQPGPVALKVRAAKPVNALDPDRSLGTSMDILSVPEIERVYQPYVVRDCLSAGWGPITYRLHTELSIEAWHWNPRGTWSDAAKQQGYFVGDAEPREPICDSFGYRPPHRGCTRHGGAWRGYSRLTDGDCSTYWKSSPYLTRILPARTTAGIRSGFSLIWATVTRWMRFALTGPSPARASTMPSTGSA
ncbi:MAG: hypothetical protein ACRD1Y_04985 [Terriglobales bacterium]